MVIDVPPVIVHVGPLALSWYGVFVALAIAAGVSLAFREARRKGLAPDAVESVAFWVFAGGIVGARALHVIDRWDLYTLHPLDVFAIWNGGLGILGAVLGGTFAGMVVVWRRGLPLGAFSDAAAPGAILGQAIGRLACLFTGDAVGRATTGFGVTYLDPGAPRGRHALRGLPRAVRDREVRPYVPPHGDRLARGPPGSAAVVDRRAPARRRLGVAQRRGAITGGRAGVRIALREAGK
jgi:phosphatidylglycerol:prolipoprotein diacylglycerol transferase